MAFYLTSEIQIGNYTNIKAAKVSWKSSVNSFTDTCTIELPRIKYLKTIKTATQDANQLRQEYVFKEEDKISISLGYNGKNSIRFVGFIKRVNEGVPVKIECEGYSYLLYDVVFSKSYSSVTVKQLLQDLTNGLAIKLSDQIPDVPLKNVRFKNASGIQVLEWLQKECKLIVYFNQDELYVGTLFGKSQKTVKVKIGWNTIKDEDFKKRWVDKKTRIVINEKADTGEVKKTKADVKKYSDEKTVKIKAGIPQKFLQEIANRLQYKNNYQGYEGSLQLFLVPAVSKGEVIEIDGNKYPEKTGRYFVENVDGDFSQAGGRQTIQLAYLMS